MNWRGLFFICVPATAIMTCILYEPLSIACYKLREPYFSCPVKAKPGKLIIRSDAMGEGDFGARRRNGRSHSGIDIQAPIGTPVYASKSGIVFCGNIPAGYGKYAMIYHPDGFQTIYGHLSNWAAYSTQKVHRGELIGFVGNTGNAQGKHIQPHLHFEIRNAGEPQDPGSLMR